MNVETDGAMAMAPAPPRQRQLVWEDMTLYQTIQINLDSLFHKRTGVLVVTVDFGPVYYFKLFFPDNLFNLISEQTNLFAEQVFDIPVDCSEHKLWRSC